MEFDKTANEGKTDAQAALRAIQTPIDLGEQLEDAGQHLGRDADAGIAHRDDDATARRPSPSPRLRRPARCTSRRCSAGSRRPEPGGRDRLGVTIGSDGSLTVSGQLRFLDERPADVERRIEDVLQRDRLRR